MHTPLVVGEGGQQNPLANHWQASGWAHALPWLNQTPVNQSYPGKAGGESNNLYAFAALKSDGSVVTWGSSSYGGDSSGVSSQLSGGVKQVFSAEQAFAALKSDGSVVTWGGSDRGGDSSGVSSQLSSGVTQVFSTQRAFAALKSDGSVVTWGSSSYGSDSSGVSS